MASRGASKGRCDNLLLFFFVSCGHKLMCATYTIHRHACREDVLDLTKARVAANAVGLFSYVGSRKRERNTTRLSYDVLRLEITVMVITTGCIVTCDAFLVNDFVITLVTEVCDFLGCSTLLDGSSTARRPFSC
ncbi:hypothetical protein MPTK1_5g10400 [Marchantia polymorpha subsp. ruderalis]|uniref:Uncharacterized protein n=2 Tax=Marchantia polymorpha TaxID=3197 RepID=A0AAF6BGX7_MARPO|nr:hypothetical protein MARPO_0048s0032 [Marchantia polymorpha]BBN11261.1 hypothetical protein Mp_5g10400 [Marchantia polymorpha subsp. ruderalis]|eukprot:PTQ38909.1 hypothetical protein MARPO_0048s0032 [Marchantia polymorpha]